MKHESERKYNNQGEEIVDRSTYPVGEGMPKEPIYIEIQGVQVLMKETCCVLCGAAFRTPQQDMSYSLYGMDFPYNKNLPREVGKLCSTCWKDVYIKSRSLDNPEAIEKAIEFRNIMGSEKGRSGEEHQKMLDDAKKAQEDQVGLRWKQFCEERDKQNKKD